MDPRDIRCELSEAVIKSVLSESEFSKYTNCELKKTRQNQPVTVLKRNPVTFDKRMYLFTLQNGTSLEKRVTLCKYICSSRDSVSRNKLNILLVPEITLEPDTLSTLSDEFNKCLNTNLPCPRIKCMCGSTNVSIEQKQTRSCDEPEDTVISCNTCKRILDQDTNIEFVYE